MYEKRRTRKKRGCEERNKSKSKKDFRKTKWQDNPGGESKQQTSFSETQKAGLKSRLCPYHIKAYESLLSHYVHDP